MGRKLVFVVIKVFISEQLTQCAMAFGVVAVVVAAHLVCHPFKLDLYDLHAEVLGVVECLIIFLGVLVLQREERLAADPTDTDFDPKIVGDPSEPSGPAFGCIEVVAWAALAVSLLSSLYATAADVVVLAQAPLRKLRHSHRVGPSLTNFNLGAGSELLLAWLEAQGASDEGGEMVRKLRKVESIGEQPQSGSLEHFPHYRKQAAASHCCSTTCCRCNLPPFPAFSRHPTPSHPLLLDTLLQHGGAFDEPHRLHRRAAQPQAVAAAACAARLLLFKEDACGLLAKWLCGRPALRAERDGRTTRLAAGAARRARPRRARRADLAPPARARRCGGQGAQGGGRRAGAAQRGDAPGGPARRRRRGRRGRCARRRAARAAHARAADRLALQGPVQQLADRLNREHVLLAPTRRSRGRGRVGAPRLVATGSHLGVRPLALDCRSTSARRALW